MLKGKFSDMNPPTLVELKRKHYQSSTLSVFNYPLEKFLLPLRSELKIADIDIIEGKSESKNLSPLFPGNQISDLLDFLSRKSRQVVSLHFTLENNLTIDSNAVDEVFLDFRQDYDLAPIIDNIFQTFRIDPIYRLPHYESDFCSELSLGKVAYYRSMNHFFASQKD